MEQKELVNKLRDFSEQGLAIAPICTAAGVNKMRFYGAVNYGKSKTYSKDIKWTGEECKLISDAINTESLVKHRDERTELEIATVDRIKAAISNGVTVAHLSRETGVSNFKLASIANFGESDCYKRISRLSDIECKKINDALDGIKDKL